MRKKQTFVIALILLSVIIWVYKSSNKEYDNIMNVIAGNNHYIRNIIIKPNETCNCKFKIYLLLI